MTATFEVEDLRAMLAEHAEEVRVPLGLAPRAVQSAGRIRRRRRALSAVAGVAAVLSLALQFQQHDQVAPPEQSPTQPQPGSTVVGQVVWTDRLPGLDLPVGEPLAVPYGVLNSVFVDGHEELLELPGSSDQPKSPSSGERLVQVAETPLGLFAVTVDGPVSNLWLLDNGGAQGIGGAHLLSGLVALGTTANGEIHIAFATDDDGYQVHEGPMLDPQLWLATPSDRRQAVGFVDGDPVFDLLDQRGSLQRFERAATGVITTDRLDTDIATGAADPVFAGWLAFGDDAFALYTDVTSGCTYAYRVPGSGAAAWNVCDEQSRAVMIVGSRYGAVGATVYDLAADGALAKAFELPSAERFDIAPIGWESPTHVILRIVSYEPYEPAEPLDGSTIPPRYVAVRCAVETGVCDRLPHPVDVIASEHG